MSLDDLRKVFLDIEDPHVKKKNMPSMEVRNMLNG